MRKYDLTINDNSYEVVIKEVTDTHARVEVNGIEHTVTINEIASMVLPPTIPRPTPSPSKPYAATAAATAGSSSAGGVMAPMPGQIKAILVREGDKVSVGQKLLIMEAMKLENKIPATRNGIVQKILVRDGDIVSQGQQLVIIG